VRLITNGDGPRPRYSRCLGHCTKVHLGSIRGAAVVWQQRLRKTRTIVERRFKMVLEQIEVTRRSNGGS
jgi:hypothetical protein